MAEVELKFLPKYKPLMLDGRKWLTTRREPHGKTGDTFDAFGTSFRLTGINVYRLAYVRAALWRGSGCESPYDFHQTWKGIYGNFDPDLTVYTHHFARIRRVKIGVNGQKEAETVR